MATEHVFFCYERRNYGRILFQIEIVAEIERSIFNVALSFYLDKEKWVISGRWLVSFSITLRIRDNAYQQYD